MKREVMAYTMNAPYKDQPAIPSDLYFMGIVEGCRSKWDFQPLGDRCVKACPGGSGQTETQSKENRSKQITKSAGESLCGIFNEKRRMQ